MEGRGQVSIEFIISVVVVLAVFVYGLSIFTQRTELNLVRSQQWEAQQAADQVARGINAVYLLDDNSLVSDTIYWSGSGKSFSLGARSVQVFYNDAYADAAIATGGVDWRVSDLNGAIFFRKINGRVVVDYS